MACTILLSIAFGTTACSTQARCPDDSDCAEGTGTGGETDDDPATGTTVASDSMTGTTDAPETTTVDDSAATTTGIVGTCEPAPGLEDVLFPLEVGRVWAYRLLCSCDWDGNLETREVTGTQMVGGREAFVLETDFGAGPSITYWTRDGQSVDRWDENNETWERVLEVPIEEGHEWGEYDKFHWEHVGEVTADSQTFSDCWKLVGCQQVDVCLSEWTYCPGIGPVAEQQFEQSYTLLGCGTPEG